MRHQIPQEILDRQLDGRRRDDGGSKTKRWLADNWLGVVTIAGWIVTQLLTGNGWVHAREATEGNLAQQVQSLRNELADARATYVRQDVFVQVIARFEQHLQSIDNSLKERR